MKKIKNKIVALVCGIVMLCGIGILAYAAASGIMVYDPETGCGAYSISNGCGKKISGTLCGEESVVNTMFVVMSIAMFNQACTELAD